MSDARKQTESANENLSGLPAPVRVAQKVGQGLGGCEILLDEM
jgi:hypothetical protein